MGRHFDVTPAVLLLLQLSMTYVPIRPVLLQARYFQSPVCYCLALRPHTAATRRWVTVARADRHLLCVAICCRDWLNARDGGVKDCSQQRPPRRRRTPGVDGITTAALQTFVVDAGGRRSDVGGLRADAVWSGGGVDVRHGGRHRRRWRMATAVGRRDGSARSDGHLRPRPAYYPRPRFRLRLWHSSLHCWDGSLLHAEGPTAWALRQPNKSRSVWTFNMLSFICDRPTACGHIYFVLLDL